MRLGAGFSFAEPFLDKPPKMHWRTYLRMRVAGVSIALYDHLRAAPPLPASAPRPWCALGRRTEGGKARTGEVRPRRPRVHDLDSNFNHYIMQILDAKWD